MTDRIKVMHDNDTNVVKISDQFNLGGDKVKVVSSDLKTQQQYNSKHMKPKLNEDSVESREDGMKPNFNRMLETDINLLANPKKTKNFSSSSEEEDEDESTGDVSTEEDTNDMGTAQGDDLLDGGQFNPFASQNDDDEEDDDDEEGEDDEEEGSEEGTEEETATSGGSRRPPQRPKTLEEIAAEKQELLYRLERLEANGFKASRKFNMNSNLEDIKFEYERIKKQRDVDKSIKFQRKILMAVASGVEFLNGKFDPFDIKLDGWSESIYENLHEYDEVFEELHEKYKSKVKVAPELRLLMMVGGSAFMFHLTNTLFKSKMPGLDQILQQNPDLANNVKQAAMNTMRNNEAASGNADPLFGMMMNQAQSMMGPKPAGGKGQMRGPSGVDDILNMVNKPKVPEKEEDTVSSVSTQGSGMKRHIKMRKPKTGNGKFVLDLQ